MVSVEKAIQLVDNNVSKTQHINVQSISNSAGFVLAKDVTSPINMPPFRQSAMDGYALGSIEENTFSLIGEVQAGDNKNPELKKGEAIRIFTGAPAPSAAKAVIMQEKVTVQNDKILLQETVKLNANIRPEGEQIKKAEIALHKGTTITAAGVGYLASLGITDIEVYKKPSIAIVTTGNELIPPGKDLAYGQIYESNSVMLSTALQKNGFMELTFIKVKDDYNDTLSVLDNAIQKYDVVIVSGGISVGDYDFVGKAFQELKVEEIFYKVKQKPGKPLYFAKKENTTIFALPGNPASSLSCFYVYVLPALQKIVGIKNFQLPRTNAISTTEYVKKGTRAEFLKGFSENSQITILDGQASSMLRSFAIANALVYIPENISKVSIGDSLQILNLP